MTNDNHDELGRGSILKHMVEATTAALAPGGADRVVP